MKFKIAEYTNTDTRCPVEVVMIGNAACNNVHADFKDAANIISTLDDGFYYAQLKDETVAGTTTFYIGVWAGTKGKDSLNF